MSYTSILRKRYASDSMIDLLSEDNKFLLWRKLWYNLAYYQRYLGVNISAGQLGEMFENIMPCPEELERKHLEFEKITKHDVVAHIKAWGTFLPKSGGIIHMGATSCFVTDNADLIKIREGLRLIGKRLDDVILSLAKFSDKWKSIPTVGFTHFQPAQLTTVGKRSSMWLKSFVEDKEHLGYIYRNIKFRGAKGAVGSQDSFLSLFQGDEEKVLKLDELLARSFGFKESDILCGQTYSRKLDMRIVSSLGEVAASASKMTNDIRLLAGLGEVFEGFSDYQVGSSAMAYKKNPVTSEKVCGLSRHGLSLMINSSFTAASQWLERSLDDSSNRRVSLWDSFLVADAVLVNAKNIIDNLHVKTLTIERNVCTHMSRVATEKIIIEMSRLGFCRQEVHEKIRSYTAASSNDADLFDKLINDNYFLPIKGILEKELNPMDYTGLCSKQVDLYLLKNKIGVIS